MAAGVATLFRPPNVHSSSTSPITRVAEKAPTMTSGRVVRSIMKFPEILMRSEAGGDAGGNGLEEHRRPVVEPEPERAEQQRTAQARGDQGNDRHRPVR